MTIPRTALPLLLMAVPPLCGQSKPVIDNEQVSVTLLTAQPHGNSAPHVHARNSVLLYLAPGSDAFRPTDGRTQELRSDAGEARWLPAGSSHTARSIGDNPYRAVEVELKNQGRSVQTSPLDPVKLAPQSYKVLLDNPQTRVLRVHLSGRQKVPPHEHSFNRVIVYLTDHHVRITDDRGKVNDAPGKAGDIVFGLASKHAEENLRDSPVEVLVVESK